MCKGSSSGTNSGLLNLLPLLLSGGSDDTQFTEDDDDALDSEEENDPQDTAGILYIYQLFCSTDSCKKMIVNETN